MSHGSSESFEKTAITIITRAIKYDNEKRYTLALTCYEEGISLLMEALKGMTDGNRLNAIRKRTSEYLSRAEALKDVISREKMLGKYEEHFKIEEGSTGNSYRAVMGRFLGSDVTDIYIEDAYLKLYHQIQNFTRLCELFIKKCPELKSVHLKTKEIPEAYLNDPQQRRPHVDLITSLASKNIKLSIECSPILHDRQIRLSNGWVIKIGRGLDYFYPPESRMSLGMFDFDLRKCHETNVDIFYIKK